MSKASRTPDTDVSSEGTKQLGIRFPIQLNQRLETLAKREGNGVSSIVRRLVVEALEARDGDEAA